MRRLSVLVSAYACSPLAGSELGVGWGWVKAISAYHDLWVLTAEHFRQEIEEELRRDRNLASRVRFIYIPRKRHRLAEILWPPMYLFTYAHQWQKTAYETAAQLHRKVHFDLVHQLTYVGFRVPGQLWRLGIPFVWGPIGGLEQTSWSLIPHLGLYGAAHFTARNLLNDLDRRFAALPKKAFAAAKEGIIAATTGIQYEIKRFYGLDSTVISEIGLPLHIPGQATLREDGQPLRLVWCGNLNPGKALHFLLDALKELPSGLQWRLDVVGDGPCRTTWQDRADKNGLSSNCEWHGKTSRETALRIMRESHILVVTSVYDLTSTVVVEAMASGVPVVCPNHCGFPDAVTSDAGILVNATTRRSLVNGITSSIHALYDENLRSRLAQGALRRADMFLWDQKAQAVSGLYWSRLSGQRTVLDESGAD